MNWPKSLKNRIRVSEPLKKHTTFKIGGPAQFYLTPHNLSELKLILKTAKKHGLPLRIIGGGSNILCQDKGLNGITLNLGEDFFQRMVFDPPFVQAGAGCRLSALMQKALSHSLGGLEFLVGIPGTVGGALAMNAGAKGASIGDLVERVWVMDYNGNLKILNRKQMGFGYRNSSLARYIILSGRFKLKKAAPQAIRRKMKTYLAQRKKTQDYSHPSAGCVFKNPAGKSAGRLIDLCGLKGKRIGDAAVSARHANFIVNLGQARAEEVLGLMSVVRKKVKAKFNLTLSPEIKIWK